MLIGFSYSFYTVHDIDTDLTNCLILTLGQKGWTYRTKLSADAFRLNERQMFKERNMEKH